MRELPERRVAEGDRREKPGQQGVEHPAAHEARERVLAGGEG